MQNIYFISDVHIDLENKNVTNKFLKFINEKSTDMKELYILGDLFEFWVDDKYDIKKNSKVISALQSISKKGVKVFLMHGNRDFMIGKNFSRETNIKILPENHILKINNKEILLTHGDLLCTDDIDYQKFRKIIRNKLVIRIFNLFNNSIKKRIANYLRGKSKEITSQKPENIMDVNEGTVFSFYKKYNIDLIIHGHTHRKNIHTIKRKNKSYMRYVLGDWHNSPSYIIWKNNKIELFDV